MRHRTLLAILVLLVALTGIAVGTIIQTERPDGELQVSWISDTARDVGGNHHAPAVNVVEGEAMVYAPISGRSNSDECELAALDAENGAHQWGYKIPAPDCAIHSVADPIVADYDSDGTDEVLAATTENQLIAYDPVSGDVEFTYELTSYGYTQPVVSDVVGDDRPEIVVVDVSGTVFVARGNGSTVWTRQLDSYTWGQPSAADFDGDGHPEVAVGAGGSGQLHLFEHNGTNAWDEPLQFDGSITWMTTGEADGDASTEIVVATALGGVVAAVDGSSGETIWARDLGSFAAVNSVADGDADGIEEVYAVANDGSLHSLDAQTGQTEWTTTLTDSEVQMMPPPSVGDVDGDGELELVAVTHDGIVSLVDPRTGEISSTYERKDVIFTNPTLADVDGDGNVEVFVMYGRGRVVAFDVATR